MLQEEIEALTFSVAARDEAMAILYAYISIYD
jgi:hypothetical protein